MRSIVERREFVKAGSIGMLAGMGAGVLSPAVAAQADAGTLPGKAKVVFVLIKRADVTHDQCVAEWGGERHVSLVKNVPGLKRWVQNRVTSLAHDSAPDGLGELWFEDAETMKKAMASPEMGAAVEDAKRFLDMTRTYALVVDERVVIG